MELQEAIFMIKQQNATKLLVKVSPGAKRGCIRSVQRENIDGKDVLLWRVQVNAPADQGKANKRLLHILATAFDLPVKNFTIVQGELSTFKLISVIHTL